MALCGSWQLPLHVYDIPLPALSTLQPSLLQRRQKTRMTWRVTQWQWNARSDASRVVDMAFGQTCQLRHVANQGLVLSREPCAH